jgi:hypothetical protein
VQVLSSQLNKTFVSLYDLAHSGAVVDGDLVDPYESVDNTFVHQISDKFLPYFSDGRLPLGNATNATVAQNQRMGKRGWEGRNTLIISLFGINDVDRAMGGYWPCESKRASWGWTMYAKPRSRSALGNEGAQDA